MKITVKINTNCISHIGQVNMYEANFGTYSPLNLVIINNLENESVKCGSTPE